MKTYAVIIPAYNSARTLDALLASLQQQDLSDFETIVVDDGSVDDTPAVAAKYPVRYERLDKRRGPANARNVGARLTDAPWLVFTDADTAFEKNTLRAIDEMLRVSGADALVGSYSGRPANKGFAPRYKALWERCIMDDRVPRNGPGYDRVNAWTPRPGVVRRDSFDKVGGFDTGFRGADLEDIELGHRLNDAGCLIIYAPSIHIRHNYPATARAELKAFARRCAIWMRMFRNRTKFDSIGESSLRQAVAHMFGFAAFIFLPAVLVPAGAAAWALMLVCFAVLNTSFIGASFRQEKPATAFLFILYCWLHSIVLGFAAAYGLLTPRPGKLENGR